jgi:endonuclease G
MLVKRLASSAWIASIGASFVLLAAGCSSEFDATPGAVSATSTTSYRKPHPKPPRGPDHGGADAGGRPVIGSVQLSSNLNAAQGIPAPSSDPEILISRHQYVISWNQQTRNLNWSAWELDTSFLGSVGRTDHFIADPDLSTYLGDQTEGAVQGTDYEGSCFDRGHQTPSGDRTDTVDDNANTFVMSNMVPQTAWLNRVIWEHFEAHTRSLVTNPSDHFYIFAGPIYGAQPGAVGPNHDIRVPAREFKILVQGGAKPQVLATVIMPNVTSAGTDPIRDNAQACADQHGIGQPPNVPENDWEKYRTTVAEVEQETGFDFSFLPAQPYN